tara:strand:+ start:681 stop:1085 length:405 start_codon:yes stop_codon:yes gene_type:complete
MNTALKKYQESVQLEQEASEIRQEMKDRLELTETSVQVGSRITIERGSSAKQYIYAISVLNSQIDAAKELDEEEELLYLEDSVEKILEMRHRKKEYDAWYLYHNQISIEKDRLHKLLSNEDKASLIELPTKPRR